MLVLADTAAHHAPHASGPLVVLVLLLFAVFYFLGAAIWPYKPCLYCRDKKKLPSPWGMGSFRMCPRCGGKGKEFRVGTRLWRGLFGHGWGRHN